MAAFATMLHGVNIDLGFIYVSLYISMTSIEPNTDHIICTEHDWHLHRLSTSRPRGHLLLVTPRIFGRHRVHLGRILLCRDHMGESLPLPPFSALGPIGYGLTLTRTSQITLAKRFSGEVSIASVGATDPCLYGCIAGIGAAAVVTITISIFHNARYGWETLGAIRLTDERGDDRDVAYQDPTYDPERLRKAAYVARGITLLLFLALFIIWPLT